MASRPSTPNKPVAVSVEETITFTEIKDQILVNADVLFPRSHDLKIVTGTAASGLGHYAAIMASDPKSASVHKEYTVLLTGAGEKTRRESLLKLLDETERRVAKLILRR